MIRRLALAVLAFFRWWDRASCATPTCSECAARRAILLACADCYETHQKLITKGDHHGGVKVVCADREACHKRQPW